ncbi:MAG: hypothetical protein KC917_10345, partial [Candidatus Omnitrophica bacterium]|nr:hypothetical protein [Candidatus Omnitrophota bacterium]
MFRPLRFIAIPILIVTAPHVVSAQHSVARQWNDELLDAIRLDIPRPTVHSRNLFHLSVGMYDAWAVYDPVAVPFLNRTESPTPGVNVLEQRNEAIS